MADALVQHSADITMPKYEDDELFISGGGTKAHSYNGTDSTMLRKYSIDPSDAATVASSSSTSLASNTPNSREDFSFYDNWGNETPSRPNTPVNECGKPCTSIVQQRGDDFIHRLEQQQHNDKQAAGSHRVFSRYRSQSLPDDFTMRVLTETVAGERSGSQRSTELPEANNEETINQQQYQTSIHEHETTLQTHMMQCYTMYDPSLALHQELEQLVDHSSESSQMSSSLSSHSASYSSISSLSSGHWQSDGSRGMNAHSLHSRLPLTQTQLRREQQQQYILHLQQEHQKQHHYILHLQQQHHQQQQFILHLQQQHQMECGIHEPPLFPTPLVPESLNVESSSSSHSVRSGHSARTRRQARRRKHRRPRHNPSALYVTLSTSASSPALSCLQDEFPHREVQEEEEGRREHAAAVVASWTAADASHSTLSNPHETNATGSLDAAKESCGDTASADASSEKTPDHGKTNCIAETTRFADLMCVSEGEVTGIEDGETNAGKLLVKFIAKTPTTQTEKNPSEKLPETKQTLDTQLVDKQSSTEQFSDTQPLFEPSPNMVSLPDYPPSHKEALDKQPSIEQPLDTQPTHNQALETPAQQPPVGQSAEMISTKQSDNATCDLFIGNLAFGADVDEIVELFEYFGELSRVSLSLVSKGRIYIKYVFVDDARKAREAMNKVVYGDRMICVHFTNDATFHSACAIAGGAN